MNLFVKLGRKLKQYKRVISISRKPSREEFSDILKVSSLGLLAMGFIGFIVQLIYQFLIQPVI